jgi:hypothetical protein
MNRVLAFDSTEWLSGFKNDLSVVDDEFTQAISNILRLSGSPLSLGENDSYFRIINNNADGEKSMVVFGFISPSD